MADALIKAKNLNFHYPDYENQDIYGVSFPIFPGEVILLAIDCRSGKSTLFSCLIGLIPYL